jgi:hypothetical protein
VTRPGISRHLLRFVVEYTAFLVVLAALVAFAPDPAVWVWGAAYVGYAVGASVGYRRGMDDHERVVRAVRAYAEDVRWF